MRSLPLVEWVVGGPSGAACPEGVALVPAPEVNI